MAIFTGTSGADTLTGGSEDDSLDGAGNNDTLNDLLGGNDTLNGGLGTDTMTGGLGDDFYFVDSYNVLTNLGDVVVENADEGTDTIQSSVSFELDAAANVEKLILTPGTASINGTGNSLNNTITGNAGNNSIDGGAGADIMIGGLGNDTYVVDHVGDIVTETSTIATELDTVKTSLTAYTLGTNVENLEFTTVLNSEGVGNGLANKITGNTGNDTLTGGAGADTLTGGAGNDTYIVNLKSSVVGTTTTAVLEDSITDTSGVDTLKLSGAIALTTASKIILASSLENLDASATGSTLLNLTGNAAANELTGNNANNIIDGGTGTGAALVADTMVGGLGNDTYVVDSLLDVVTEAASAGTDTVQSSISFDLSTVANVEKLVLTGTAALTATGTTLADTITGNTGANTIDGGAGVDTMIGGDGNDTYIVDSLLDVVTETNAVATQIDTIETALNYTLGATSLVENITITGAALTATGNGRNNSLLGNDNNNTLTGAAGNDTLDGGTGTDTLVGGTGNDTYITDVDTDVITEATNVVAGVATGGKDTVIASYDYILDTGTGATAAAILASTKLENLTLDGAATTGTGNGLANVLKANDTLASTLNGMAGNDTLDGSVGAGADVLVGGTGSDIYFVGAGDSVTETSTLATEIDTVNASVTYALGSNVERLILTGTANIDGTGNSLNNTITGNAGINNLVGDAGNDSLSGGGGNDTLTGGAGKDTLTGGAGSDTYHVQLKTLTNATTGATTAAFEDIFTEAAGTANGTADTVIIDAATVFTTTTTITLGLNIENLDASATGSAKLNLTGNIGNNSIIGNDFGNIMTGGANTTTGVITNGNDTLDGGAGNDSISGGVGNDSLIGGLGNDTLVGGTGNDTFVVDSLLDVVTEAAAGGTDTIQTDIDYSIAALAQVENLTLTGTENVDATGNAGNNVLTGNAGNNILDGGAGNDTMAGGTGDDTYVVDSLLDVVTEAAAGGTDTIETGITYSIAALDQVENLTLTGSANVNATGNTGNNVLTGNTGDNILDGGDGDDNLTGGTGNDIFVFDTALGVSNVDVVTDFDIVDQFQLDDAIFGVLGLGALSVDSFVAGDGVAAVDADDFILYDTTTGALYYDADGVGGTAAVQFATLSSAPTISEADFTIV